mgnify:FL=1
MYTYRFSKILDIQEQEKIQIEIIYKESVKSFEEVATKLYEMLKKKEDLIAYQNERLTFGASIDEVTHYASFINSLEKTIEDLQKKVAQARVKMNWHEEKLLEKNIEVRKYEKMREKDFGAFQVEQERLENIRLDELSTMAYYKKEIR